MTPNKVRRVFEVMGLLVAVGLLVTVMTDMFWGVTIGYMLTLLSCCIALSDEEEF